MRSPTVQVQAATCTETVSFESEFQKGTLDQCWPHHGGTDRRGYARTRIHAPNGPDAHKTSWQSAALTAWQIAHSGAEIPEGYKVVQTCHNKRCVNPTHLRLMTRDQARHFNRPIGERNGQAKINPDTVETFYAEYASGLTHEQISKRHLISESTVREALLKHNWKNAAPNLVYEARDDHHGEANNHADLTDEEVIEIRKMEAAGNLTQQDIADTFEVDRSLVSHIHYRRKWGHLP